MLYSMVGLSNRVPLSRAGRVTARRELVRLRVLRLLVRRLTSVPDGLPASEQKAASLPGGASMDLLRLAQAVLPRHQALHQLEVAHVQAQRGVDPDLHDVEQLREI